MMVTVRQQSFRLALDQNAERVALVLGAGKPASQSPADTLALAMRVIRELPASVMCDVYILGNPRVYDRRQFEEQGEALLRENVSRVSLIGPIMRGLAQGGPLTRIAVLGSPRIFDLDDWQEWGHLFVFLTDRSSQERFALWRTVSNPGELAAALYDPINRVEIKLAGFVPVHWDNAGYTLAIKEGALTLSADSSCTAMEVGIAGIVCQTAQPIATLVRRSGNRTTIALARGDAADSQGQDTIVDLLPDECRVFQSAAKQECFECPHCGDHHAADQFRCDNDLTPQFRFGGRPVYPSLAEAMSPGLFLCVDAGPTVRCTFAGQSHFDVENGRVLAVIEKSLYAAAITGDTIHWSAAVRLRQNYVGVADESYVLHYC